MNKLPISVVIPTMNRPDTLKMTLEYLINKDFIPNQIILVDQSPDGINQKTNRDCLQQFADLTEIKYIFQEIPSLTKARNTGLTYCKNDIVIYSDDDVKVGNDTLNNVFKVMEEKSVAMIAGIDLNTKKTYSKIGYLFGTKSYKNRHIGHVTLSMLGRYPDEIFGEVETQWAMGYFFVIRKSLAEKWNLKWDENLTSYAYAEDLDYSYAYYKKAKQKSMKCILSDKVQVWHLVSKEYRIPSKKQTYMFVINREYLSYKHMRGFNFRMANRWTNIGHMIRLVSLGKNPTNLIKAQWCCERNRKLIKQGKIKELY